jgi:hypothetical protein
VQQLTGFEVHGMEARVRGVIRDPKSSFTHRHTARQSERRTEVEETPLQESDIQPGMVEEHLLGQSVVERWVLGTKRIEVGRGTVRRGAA